MHTHACKQYVFLSCNKSLSVLRILMEVLSHANAKKKENAKEFQVSHFYWSFLSDTGAVKGFKKKVLVLYVTVCVCACIHVCLKCMCACVYSHVWCVYYPSSLTSSL